MRFPDVHSTCSRSKFDGFEASEQAGCCSGCGNACEQLITLSRIAPNRHPYHSCASVATGRL